MGIFLTREIILRRTLTRRGGRGWTMRIAIGIGLVLGLGAGLLQAGPATKVARHASAAAPRAKLLLKKTPKPPARAIRADLQPFWRGRRMVREPLLFLKKKAGGAPTARLLFVPTQIQSVISSSGRQSFTPGRDYLLKPGTNLLTLTAHSRIPFKTWAQTHPPVGAPLSIAAAVGGKTNLLWKEGPYFQRLEVEVTYQHSAGWKGYVPHSAARQLGATIGRLTRHKPLNVVILGDSVSQGYSASGFFHVPPYMPAYPGLVAAGLRQEYGSNIVVKNLSLAGTGAQWGVGMVPKVLAAKPDLVIVAFGLNDASAGVTPASFQASYKAIIAAVRRGRPHTQFVLVASMTGNPEWTGTHTAIYPQYATKLADLTGPGVALANITAIWREFLKTKNFLDLTGNGVNHPNDFGQRVYAQVILALLQPAAPYRARRPAARR